MVPSSVWMALLVLATIAATMASVVAQTLREFSRSRLERVCRCHHRPQRLASILQYRHRCILPVLTLRVFALVGVVMGAVAWLGLPGGLALSAAILLVFETWAARSIAHLWCEPILFRSWPMLYGLARLSEPMLLVAHGLDQLLHRLAGRPLGRQRPTPIEDEIRSVIHEAQREGVLEEEARKMVESVFELREADVAKIMTPRTDMVTIPEGASLEEARRVIIESAHSRVPIHGENRDDIVGILYVRDLLANLGDESSPRRTLPQIMRKPYFVPETKSVPSLLQEFQRNHVQIAIVLDEYGGVSGLVTIEDIFEEIVGEIADEYEPPPPPTIHPVAADVVEVDGRVHIDELNDRLGLNLPEDGDFDTVGGFVFSHLGRLPQIGEQFEYGNVRITMLRVGKRRIDRVKIEIGREPQQTPADHE